MGEPTAPASAVSPGRGAALVLLAAALWGTGGTAQALGPAGITAPATAATRALIGGGLLVAVVALRREGASPMALVRHAPGATVVGAMAMAVFQLGYFGGIQLAGVAIGTLVVIGSAPISAGLLDLLRGRPPGRRWAVATVVTLSGTGLLLVPGADGQSADPLGVGVALVGGVAYAVYMVASKAALDRGAPPSAAVAGNFGGAALLLAPLLLVVDVGWVATPRGLAVLAWLGPVTIALGYTVFIRGLQGVQASTATTLNLAEPVVAALLAVVVLGERLTGPALAGAALVGAGLLLVGGGSRVPGRLGRWRVRRAESLDRERHGLE